MMKLDINLDIVSKLMILICFIIGKLDMNLVMMSKLKM